MLCSSSCVPRSSFSREAAVLLRLTGALCCWGKSWSKMTLFAQAHRKGKNPSKNFSAAVVSQQIKLRLDRPLLQWVASARHIPDQSDWNYIEWNKFTEIRGVQLALLVSGFKEALTENRSLLAMVSLHGCLAGRSKSPTDVTGTFWKQLCAPLQPSQVLLEQTMVIAAKRHE